MSCAIHVYASYVLLISFYPLLVIRCCWCLFMWYKPGAKDAIGRRTLFAQTATMLYDALHSAPAHIRYPRYVSFCGSVAGSIPTMQYFVLLLCTRILMRLIFHYSFFFFKILSIRIPRSAQNIYKMYNSWQSAAQLTKWNQQMLSSLERRTLNLYLYNCLHIVLPRYSSSHITLNETRNHFFRTLRKSDAV